MTCPIRMLSELLDRGSVTLTRREAVSDDGKKVLRLAAMFSLHGRDDGVLLAAVRDRTPEQIRDAKVDVLTEDISGAVEQLAARIEAGIPTPEDLEHGADGWEPVDDGPDDGGR